MFERTSALPTKVLLAIAFGVASLFGMLGFSSHWQGLELKGFDALSRQSAPNASTFPITVVAIDEASFSRVARQWPWPRALYARLIDQLARSGALVIGLDIVLAEPSSGGAEDDAALARAIERAGNVVLASDRVYAETAVSRQWLRVDPLPGFIAAGASNGYANVAFDRDLVMRRMPSAADAFWKKVVERLAAVRPGLVDVTLPPVGAMIRYAGAEHTFPYVSLYQALDPAKYLPPDAFRGQIVLVGRDIKANIDARSAQADLFATPFTAATGGLMPGVELHANFLETAFSGKAVQPVAAGWNVALVIAVVAACAFAMRRWRPLPGALAAATLFALLAALDWVLFQRMNLWLPVLSAMASAATMYLACGAVAFGTERQRRGELRRAPPNARRSGCAMT